MTGQSRQAGPFEKFSIKLGNTTVHYNGDSPISEVSQAQGTYVLPGTLDLEDGSTISVAIKCKKIGDKKLAKSLKNDIRELSRSDHPDLITYFDCAVADVGGTGKGASVIIVMEMMECSLLDLFFSNAEFIKNVTYGHYLRIFKTVAEGIQQLHGQGFVHFDLKTSSILASKKGEVVKIGDYGSCKVLSPGRASVTITSKQNMKYSAPELAAASRTRGVDGFEVGATQEVDIYSFGCVMWECLNGVRLGERVPEPHRNGRTIMFGGIRRSEEVHCNGPEVLCQLIEDCLKCSEHGIDSRCHGRPTTGEIVKRLREMQTAEWVHYRVRSCTEVVGKGSKLAWFLKVREAVKKFVHKRR